jgi:hypothetical protein
MRANNTALMTTVSGQTVGGAQKNVSTAATLCGLGHLKGEAVGVGVGVGVDVGEEIGGCGGWDLFFYVFL